MANKFPINQSFQRLNNKPLDETTVFNTLAQAQDYAKNNPTSYVGQIIHIKDFRTNEEKNNNVEKYGVSCYIDTDKDIKPICSFTYRSLNTFFDLMYEMINGPTETTKEKLDYLYELIMGEYKHNPDESPEEDEGFVDYKDDPFNPKAYSDNQICLRMTQATQSNQIGKYSYEIISIEGSSYEIENIESTIDDQVYYFKIITLNESPTKVNFRYGRYIKEVIHMCDTSKIVDMNGMFEGCESLSDIKDINTWDVSSATDMSYMFCGCRIACEVFDLSGWNTKNVINMHEMFHSATYMNCKVIDCRDWNTSKVTDMVCMFGGNTMVKTIYCNNWDVSKVTSMSSMFISCKELISLNIDNWNIQQQMESYEYMFSYTPYLILSNIERNGCSTATETIIRQAMVNR